MRILATIPVVGVVAVVVFLLLRLSPGDPAAVLAGDMATPDDIQRIRVALGLDEPIITQFTIWIGQLLRGDFGTSIISNLPVTQMIAQRIEPTVALATTTIIFAVLIAVPLGVLAAWKHNTWWDRGVMALSIFGFSIPVFTLGYLWIYSFSVSLRWLPVQGYKSIFDGVVPFLQHMILPTLTLSLVYIALIARITRASMLEVMGEDYIRTAHSKGLGNRRILYRHALMNAAVPIITVIGIGIALLITGVVVTESVFNIPGLGRLTVDAVLSRDYPIIQAMIIIFAGVYLLLNLLIDIAYIVLDPRIRY